MADGALRYDVTAFRSEFKDYQFQGAVPLSAGGEGFSLISFGNLRVQECNFVLNGTTLQDLGGERLNKAQWSQRAELGAGATSDLSDVLTAPASRLWNGTKDPFLYTLRVSTLR